MLAHLASFSSWSFLPKAAISFGSIGKFAANFFWPSPIGVGQKSLAGKLALQAGGTWSRFAVAQSGNLGLQGFLFGIPLSMALLLLSDPHWRQLEKPKRLSNGAYEEKRKSKIARRKRLP